jgi:hypothetical protein
VSTMRCAGAVTRRTSRSAAACTDAWSSVTRCLVPITSQPSSNGPAACPRCCG